MRISFAGGTASSAVFRLRKNSETDDANEHASGRLPQATSANHPPRNGTGAGSHDEAALGEIAVTDKK